MKKEIYDISKKYLENVESILPQLEREILLEFMRFIGNSKNNFPIIIFNGGAILANVNGPELFGISHLLFSSGKWKYNPEYFTNKITLGVLRELETPVIPYSNIPSLKKLIELGKDFVRESLINLFSGTTMTKEEFLKIANKINFNFPISNHSILRDGIKFYHIMSMEKEGDFEVSFKILRNGESRYVRLTNINSISFAEKLIDLYEKE